ncbi:glycine zipper 2TM domain-containing protein [Melaminivora alkalimesophila]|uniref:Osmotically inducible lipoprotein OsmB n=1 Tax=Melaminivora alkalimesophila TaxID=1165852 RepID=A0A317RFR4_9BURK|nr:glycine zipper 2TM domain-containing protein [Melaminivora alkalimesophila]PWW48739.1 osmotically inducible lipoprotein OsmB [Melaminivora alkalimesophila]
MTYRHCLYAAVCAAALGLAGCSSNPTNAQMGTGIGAVAGGVVGSAVGGTAATVGGAAAGALIGHEVGKDRDNRQGRR